MYNGHRDCAHYKKEGARCTYNIRRKAMSKVQLPVHKNETVTGTVLDLTYQGNGVVKVDHYPIFVPNTLQGEEVTVKVTKVTKNFAWGKLISIEKKSPDRIDNPNWAYLQTGIAPLGNLTYPAQLKFRWAFSKSS